MKTNQREVDIYRDTPVRYLGYTNEVGEAFRSIVPRSIVRLSYVIASGYVLADTAHKGNQVYKVSIVSAIFVLLYIYLSIFSQKDTTKGRNKRILLSTTDTLLWQSFASVVIPGIIINRICATTRFIQRYAKTPIAKSPWISTIVGLVSIPFIIRPIDTAVEETMNVTYRQWTGYHPHDEPPENELN